MKGGLAHVLPYSLATSRTFGLLDPLALEVPPFPRLAPAGPTPVGGHVHRLDAIGNNLYTAPAAVTKIRLGRLFFIPNLI
jgi:hypothetical protein